MRGVRPSDRFQREIGMDCPHCGKKIEADDEPWKSSYRDGVLITLVSGIAVLIASALGFGWQVQVLAGIAGAFSGAVLAVFADNAYERDWKKRHGT